MVLVVSRELVSGVSVTYTVLLYLWYFRRRGLQLVLSISGVVNLNIALNHLCGPPQQKKAGQQQQDMQQCINVLPCQWLAGEALVMTFPKDTPSSQYKSSPVQAAKNLSQNASRDKMTRDKKKRRHISHHLRTTERKRPGNRTGRVSVKHMNHETIYPPAVVCLLVREQKLEVVVLRKNRTLDQ